MSVRNKPREVRARRARGWTRPGVGWFQQIGVEYFGVRGQFRVCPRERVRRCEPLAPAQAQARGVGVQWGLSMPADSRFCSPVQVPKRRRAFSARSRVFLRNECARPCACARGSDRLHGCDGDASNLCNTNGYQRRSTIQYPGCAFHERTRRELPVFLARVIVVGDSQAIDVVMDMFRRNRAIGLHRFIQQLDKDNWRMILGIGHELSISGQSEGKVELCPTEIQHAESIIIGIHAAVIKTGAHF